MKTLILILTAFFLVACSSIPAPKYRYDWGLDRENKAVMATFNQDKRDCEDIAFKATVAGSRYSEWDIALGCMERRGYKLSKVKVN